NPAAGQSLPLRHFVDDRLLGLVREFLELLERQLFFDFSVTEELNLAVLNRNFARPEVDPAVAGRIFLEQEQVSSAIDVSGMLLLIATVDDFCCCRLPSCTANRPGDFDNKVPAGGHV